MITVAEFALYVGADTSDSIGESFDVAVTLVDDVLSSAYRAVPDDVRDRLVLEVGHALLKRKDSPGGSSQGVDFSSGMPVQGPRDPLSQSMPIIRRYVLGL